MTCFFIGIIGSRPYIFLMMLTMVHMLVCIRYVTVGTSWLNGAFSKVTKAGQVAGTKTREKWNTALSNLTAKVHLKLLLH